MAYALSKVICQYGEHMECVMLINIVQTYLECRRYVSVIFNEVGNRARRGLNTYFFHLDGLVKKIECRI